MMKTEIKKQSRRAFIKTSVASAGGMVLSFSWLSNQARPKEYVGPASPVQLTGHILIKEDNTILIYSQNPEIGQNIKTSMPMIIADEMDADWANVVVEQAGLNTKAYQRQVAGGSQSIHRSWDILRNAGATARKLLIDAAAMEWNTKPKNLRTENSFVLDKSGNKLSYGKLASTAAKLEVPKNVPLKDPKEFKLIGNKVFNVDSKKIITGQPLFGIDTQREGMVYARVMRPPAFGTKLLSFDDSDTKKVNVVSDVFEFENKIAVIANSTWAAIQGVKALKASWSNPRSSEDSKALNENLLSLANSASAKPRVNQGNIEQAWQEADKVLESTFEAPFLPHNCLEPMNFFAHVTAEKVELHGPIQTPANTRKAVAQALKRSENEIEVGLSRMGGGFGRRLKGDFVLEAALISDKIRKPVQLIYTREDDMTAGVYRPASTYKAKGSVKNGKLKGFHLVGAGIRMRNTVRPGLWPQGAVANFKLESHSLKSEITTGAWRAPTSNFLAYAEQVFIDELAEAAGKDPLDFRLESIKQAELSPIGKIKYEPKRLAGAIELAAEKSDWYNKANGIHRGVSAYFSHDSYVAEVAEISIKAGQPHIERIVVAVDFGLVVNPLGAINQAQGGAVDGIGHAMYGDFGFDNGAPKYNNFNAYRLIRNSECPKVEVHFVESNVAPTGLGEPTLPPAGAALANAIYAGFGKRLYSQPFSKQGISLV